MKHDYDDYQVDKFLLGFWTVALLSVALFWFLFALGMWEIFR